jgi:hypothetical protein
VEGSRSRRATLVLVSNAGAWLEAQRGLPDGSCDTESL